MRAAPEPEEALPATDAVVRNIGQRSLSARAREAILESIIANRFENGRIPPEHELADMLGVSRTTVRSALQSLQDAGMIVRTRGRGTMVRSHAGPSTLALQRLVGFTQLLRETGREPSVDSNWKVTADPPAEALGRLDLVPGEEYHVVDKLFRADGGPAIWVLHVFPDSYLRHAFGPEDELLDWFEFGERYGRVPVDHALVEIRADLADDVTAPRLELAIGTPLIVLHETHFSSADEPLGYSRVTVNQDYVTFQVLRTV